MMILLACVFLYCVLRDVIASLVLIVGVVAAWNDRLCNIWMHLIWRNLTSHFHPGICYSIYSCCIYVYRLDDNSSWFDSNLSLSRRLDANHITVVPEDSFQGLQQLRHLWLDDNSLTEVPVVPLQHQGNLQALTLALNRIGHIPDNAFANLSSLVVLWVQLVFFFFFFPRVLLLCEFDQSCVHVIYVISDNFAFREQHHISQRMILLCRYSISNTNV